MLLILNVYRDEKITGKFFVARALAQSQRQHQNQRRHTTPAQNKYDINYMQHIYKQTKHRRHEKN